MVAPGGTTARSMKLQPPASALASATRQKSMTPSPPCARTCVKRSAPRLHRLNAVPVIRPPSDSRVVRTATAVCKVGALTACEERSGVYKDDVGERAPIPSKDYARQARALWPELIDVLEHVLLDD